MMPENNMNSDASKRNPGEIKAGSQDETEFICSFFFFYNNDKKVQELCIFLETIKLFSVLNYGLTVEAEVKTKVIYINILGVSTKHTYSTEPKPAEAACFFENFDGKYEVNIMKQDGSINSCIVELDVSQKEMKIIKELFPEKENNRHFCSFEIAIDRFTFS